jgi:hypothetical protein
MWRSFLICLGSLALAGAGCDPLLIAKPDPSDYEVVTFIAG